MLRNLPYEMQWRIDENGTPYSIAMEETVVVSEPYTSIVLEEIPDSYQRVLVTDISEEVTKMMVGEVASMTQVKEGKYFVDYNNGVIHFAPEMIGKTLRINYYGRGFKRINAKRIVGLETNVRTVASEGDGSQERIMKLEKAVQHLQKQIDFLITELESRNY